MQRLNIVKQLPEPGWSIYPPEVVKKRIVVVEFEHATFKDTGKQFRWIPTYDQLIEILGALAQIEDESWGDKNEMQSGQ
jgi:hypothetical protein